MAAKNQKIEVKKRGQKNLEQIHERLNMVEGTWKVGRKEKYFERLRLKGEKEGKWSRAKGRKIDENSESTWMIFDEQKKAGW